MESKFDYTSIIAVILVLGMAFVEFITLPFIAIFLYFLSFLWLIIIIYEFITTKNYTNLLIKLFILVVFINETKHTLLKVIFQ